MQKCSDFPIGVNRLIWEEGGMNKGPIAIEMENLLIATFSPTRLAVINDSASHSGHSGDDGSGESHFTIEIEADAFVGVSRVLRQRMVNKALGDIPGQRVHALAIKASAVGE
jgi:BolA family transcriptional regulator, general stress-responsive regulator